MDERRSRTPRRPRVTITSRDGERTTLTEQRRDRHTDAAGDAEARSAGLRLRRGLGNLGLTLLLPGSMQARAGNARLGRVAMRLWLATWAAIALWLAVLLIDRGAAIAIIANPVVSTLVTAWLVVAGIAWCLLVVDAWRLSRPPTMARQHRLGFAAVSGALAVSLVGGMAVSATAFHAQTDALASILSGGGDTEVKEGRYNVLLLGGDAGTGRVGLRPDSITVASIDAETGRTVLFGLPRNLQGLSFPADSPMRKLYPDGFDCPQNECLLNAVYTMATEAAQQDPDLYPGVKDPGAQATREIVEETLGLQINYHVLIDLKGFETLIDAVGGITVDINKPIPVGGGSTEVGRYIGPGQDMHLGGRDALWFARSRSGSSDYERMERQRCVMNAMLDQLDPVTVATKFTDIARAGKQIAATDIPATEVDTFLDLAEKARTHDAVSVDFVPPMIEPGSTDVPLVRRTVRETIAAAETADGATPGAAPTPAPAGTRAPAAPAPAAPASAAPQGGAEPFVPVAPEEGEGPVCSA